MLHCKAKSKNEDYWKEVGCDCHQGKLSTVAYMALKGKLFRICKMISNKLLDTRDDLIFKLRWALCNPNCEIV